MFKTGHYCPISGHYSFVKHTDSSPCMLPHKEMIFIKKFDFFPVTRSCGNPAFWVLLRDDLVDEMKNVSN